MTSKEVLDTIQDRLAWTVRQYIEAAENATDPAIKQEFTGCAVGFSLFGKWILMNVHPEDEK